MRLPLDGSIVSAEMAAAFNDLADLSERTAAEIIRVARETGVISKLGAQAEVEGVGGTWHALTDMVNAMAAHLTLQIRTMTQVALALGRGDTTQKVTADAEGEILVLKEALNALVDQHAQRSSPDGSSTS